MMATGLKLLLPVRPRLGLGQGQFDLARDDKWGRHREVVSASSRLVSGNRATVFSAMARFPLGWGPTSAPQPMVISDTALPNSFSIHVLTTLPSRR